MKLSIYSVYDTVARVFNKPFTEINDGTAIRVFTQSVKENENKNDYTLYHLGEYFDHNGSIDPIKDPVKIYSGFDVNDNVLQMPTNLQEQAK